MDLQRWVAFYLPFFDSLAEAEGFVIRCEQQTPPNNTAKIMMHQTQRLISTTDRIPELRLHSEPLQLLFLMISAEHIAKLYEGFQSEGKSHEYTYKFFETFVSAEDRNKLQYDFADNNDRPLGLKSTIDLLYAIRCDVVHEGRFWGFAFHDGTTSMQNADPDVMVRLSLCELRDIVVRGCITAIKQELLRSSN